MDSIAMIRRVYGLFACGDIASLVALFDPQIEWRSAEGNPAEPTGKPWIGPNEITEKLFRQVGEKWSGFEIAPQRFHAAGETVVVEGRYGGVFKATGRSLHAQVCHVWTLHAGKVVRFQQYIDTAQLQWVTASGLAAPAAART